MFACALASAQDGVTADTILIGRSAGITGSLSVRAKPVTEALTAYFEQINAAGGIHGRKIKFINVDDGSDPKRTVENVRKLAHEDKVLSLIAIPGTPQMQAALPVATDARVPIVGTGAGADSLRKPNPVLFHLKASYGQEYDKMAEHLKTIGLLRVAIVNSDDPAGRENRDLARAALQRLGIKPLGEIGFVQGSGAPAAVEQLSKLDAQAVILCAIPIPGTEFYKEYVKRPVRPQVFAWDVLVPEALYKEVGEKIYGLVVAQVVPSPADRSVALSREYQALIKNTGLPDGGYTGLEGYVYGRVMVEALKRAGKGVTREKLIATLESMNGFDLGGDMVNFSPADHVGRRFVELTMVGKNGKFIK